MSYLKNSIEAGDIVIEANQPQSIETNAALDVTKSDARRQFASLMPYIMAAAIVAMPGCGGRNLNEEKEALKTNGVGEVSAQGLEGGAISVDETAEWEKVGIRNEEDILELKKEGLSLVELQEWAIIGVDIKEIKSFKESDISLVEAQEWFKFTKLWDWHGTKLIQLIRFHREINVSITELNEWLHAGLSVNLEFYLREFKKRGLEPSIMKAYPYDNARNFLEAIDNGISATEAHEWKNAGITEVSDILEFKKMNLQVKDIEGYPYDGGDESRAQLILYSLSFGVSIAEAIEWEKVCIDDPFRIARFKKLGITSTDYLRHLVMELSTGLWGPYVQRNRCMQTLMEKY